MAALRQRISASEIVDRVAAFYKMPRERILDSDRAPAAVDVRNVALYLCRDITGQSYREIARQLGLKYPRGIVRAVDRVTTRQGFDVEFSRELEECRQTVLR